MVMSSMTGIWVRPQPGIWVYPGPRCTRDLGKPGTWMHPGSRDTGITGCYPASRVCPAKTHKLELPPWNCRTLYHKTSVRKTFWSTTAHTTADPETGRGGSPSSPPHLPLRPVAGGRGGAGEARRLLRHPCPASALGDTYVQPHYCQRYV